MRSFIIYLAFSAWAVVVTGQNVGIGTTTPRGGLEINLNSTTGSLPGAQLLLVEDENDYARIRLTNSLYNAGTNNRFWDIAARIDETATGQNSYLNFYRHGFGDVLSLRGNGWVGIGTFPNAPLHVNSSQGFTALINGGSGMYMGLYEQGVYRGYIGSFSGKAEDVDFGTGGSNATGSVHLTTQATPRLSILPNGNVGIGTTNPQMRLDISGAMRLTGALFLGGSSGISGQVLTSQGASAPIWRDPGLPRQAVMVGFNTTRYNIPAGGNHLILFSKKIFDDANRFNLTNGRFTAPATGLYQISVDIQWHDIIGVAADWTIFLRKNADPNSTIQIFRGRGSGLRSVNFCHYYKLNNGDFLTLHMGQGDASDRNFASDNSYMTIVRLY